MKGILNLILFSIMSIGRFAQENLVGRGATSANNKEPLSAVTVIIREATNGTIIYIDEKYQINAPEMPISFSHSLE